MTTDTVRAKSRQVRERAAREEERPGFRRLAQIGLVARAIVYLVVAVLGFEVAVKRRSPGTQADTQGALHEVALQAGGHLLLSVLAAGLAAYALWRLAQAFAGAAGSGASAHWRRAGWVGSGALYVVLCIEAVGVINGSSSSSSSHPEPLVAHILRWPAGPELLGLVSFAVVCGGVALALWGVLHDYSVTLEQQQLGRWFSVARGFGIVGDVARGAVLVLVAVYGFSAAVSVNPREAKGVGAAITALARHIGGPEIVGLLAAGLGCFAVFSVVEAAFRRSPRR